MVDCILSFSKTLMEHIFVIKINYVLLQKVFLRTFVNAVNLKKYAILLVNRSCIFFSKVYEMSHSVTLLFQTLVILFAYQGKTSIYFERQKITIKGSFSFPLLFFQISCYICSLWQECSSLFRICL